MADVPDLDLFSFKVALDQSVAVGDAKAKINDWERLFCTRLEKAVSSGDVLVSHDFVGDLARTHIEDFLEVYRATTRRINFASGPLHDRSDVVLHIQVRRRQNLVQRVLNLYGSFEEELNIPLSSVRRITGTAQNFSIRSDGITYTFGDQGLRREQRA
jgi:hypothetical protein